MKSSFPSLRWLWIISVLLQHSTVYDKRYSYKLVTTNLKTISDNIVCSTIDNVVQEVELELVHRGHKQMFLLFLSSREL